MHEPVTGQYWLIAWTGWTGQVGTDVLVGMWIAYPVDATGAEVNDRYEVRSPIPGRAGGAYVASQSSIAPEGPQGYISHGTPQETKDFMCGVAFSALQELLVLVDWTTVERLEQKPDTWPLFSPEVKYYTDAARCALEYLDQKGPNAGKWLEIPKYRLAWETVLQNILEKRLHPAKFEPMAAGAQAQSMANIQPQQRFRPTSLFRRP